MKPMHIAKSLLVAVLQTICFLGGWALLVSVARSYGRFPPELFFGITTYYGAVWIVSLFVVCGVVALAVSKPLMRWGVICIGLVAWLIWLWPSFDSRPFAMPTFFALGAVLLILGTGVAIPLLTRATSNRTRGQTNGDAAEQPATAGESK